MNQGPRTAGNLVWFMGPSVSVPRLDRSRNFARRLTAGTALIALCLALGACKSTQNDVTGSIGAAQTPLPRSQGELRQFAEAWGRRFEANEKDKVAAITYARALRALTRYAEAAAVMRQIALHMPNDMEVLANYGKALADSGRLQEAAQVLENAHTPERPNWSVLSTLGSIADQLGDHARAQDYYQSSLKIAPGEPSVLSNLGLSYALAKQLPLAEQTLRQAANHPYADGRVRQNLALVLALQGKFAEAEQVASRDLPPSEAAENIATVRRMIAQSNTWRDIQALDKPKPAAKPKPARAAAVAPAAATAPGRIVETKPTEIVEAQ
jgi:Flp pilus assembly protein TadD